MIAAWNSGKALSNLAKHGVAFEAVYDFIWETALIIPDTRRKSGEQRWAAFGMIENRLHTLVFAHRGEHVRVISLRKSNAREKRNYEKASTQKADTA